MHDNANHSSNATHDGADSNREGDAGDAEHFLLLMFYSLQPYKAWGAFILVNRE